MELIYQAKDYVKETVKAMIYYMFKEVEINGISPPSTVKDNVEASRIFEKLGFNKIGKLKEELLYTFYDGLLALYICLIKEVTNCYE